MDHAEAARTAAVEKYLLHELPGPEREAFEEHFFSCEECAGQVRMGAVFQANARAVQKEVVDLATIPPERRGSWIGRKLSGWILEPSWGWAAAGVLAVVCGYQSFLLTRPRSGVAEFALMHSAQANAVRAGGSIQISRKVQEFPISIPHEWEDPYRGYTGELIRPDKTTAFKSSIGEGPGDFTVTIPASALPPGNYVLDLSGLRADGRTTTVARVALDITD